MDVFVERGLPAYTAARLSVTERCDQRIDDLYSGRQYVWGFETSKKGELHYHVVLHGLYDTRLKQRWQRFGGGRAKKWSAANHKNDFVKGISYTVKGGDFKVVGEEMEYWVPRSPAWVFHSADAVKKDANKYLTFRTALKEIRAYRDSVPDLAGKKFMEVLVHMFEHTGWRPDEYLSHRGMPQEWEWEFDRPKKEFSESYTDVLLKRGRGFQFDQKVKRVRDQAPA